MDLFLPLAAAALAAAAWVAAAAKDTFWDWRCNKINRGKFWLG